MLSLCVDYLIYPHNAPGIKCCYYPHLLGEASNWCLVTQLVKWLSHRDRLGFAAVTNELHISVAYSTCFIVHVSTAHHRWLQSTLSWFWGPGGQSDLHLEHWCFRAEQGTSDLTLKNCATSNTHLFLLHSSGLSGSRSPSYPQGRDVVFLRGGPVQAGRVKPAAPRPHCRGQSQVHSVEF